MKNIFLILMLLPTLLLAGTPPEQCKNLPAKIVCDNWILNGETQKTSEWECLVEEKLCRNLNGCGAVVGKYIEKRLSGSCSLVLDSPQLPSPKFSKCTECKYIARANTYRQACGTWNESAEKWESIVVATCTR